MSHLASAPAAFPALGDPATAFATWFGEPVASSVHDFVLLSFDHEGYRLLVLCAGLEVVAIRCTYVVAPPSWPVMQDDARRFLPRSRWQRLRQRTQPPIPAEGGWTLARLSVPDYALRALAAQ